MRDSFLGRKSKDIDFAVEAPSFDAMRSDLLFRGVKIFLEKPEYLTIRGSHPTYRGVDYVLCRKDGAYSDARHPDSVEVGSLLDDLARRDFTCNAMAIDEDSNIIDPFYGRDSINSNILHCVGDARKRFSEDALRMLRAIRFNVTLGFTNDDYIHTLLSNPTFFYPLLDKIPNERIIQELDKAFRYDVNTTLDMFETYSDLRNYIFSRNKIWLRPTLEAK